MVPSQQRNHYHVTASGSHDYHVITEKMTCDYQRYHPTCVCTEERNYNEAVRLMRQLLRVAPGHVDAMVLLATLSAGARGP